MVTEKLDFLVSTAQAGDKDALSDLVRQIQDRVHHLAMRLLVNFDDALEATQDILILVITKLSTFRGDSAFHTWVYRVATNYLLSAIKVLARDPGLSFETFRNDLESSLTPAPAASVEDTIALNELRISRTMAMLLCLDLKHRIAYVLGDILEFDHARAAEVLDISKANYRKRLSRARGEVVAFTAQSCGLVNAGAKCSCPRRLPAAVAMGRVQPGNNTYAVKGAPSYNEVLAEVKTVEGELKTLKLQTAIPHFKSPKDLSTRISRIFEPP